MTYYDEAELVYLFSGAAGKPGNGISRAYSFKPDNKDVIINRGSDLSATRIGKDGLLEKGREQLLVNTVFTGMTTDGKPTGYNTSVTTGTGTIGPLASDSTKIKCEVTNASGGRFYINETVDAPNQILCTSVFVDEVTGTAPPVYQLVRGFFTGSGARVIIHAALKDGVVISEDDLVEAGHRYAFVALYTTPSVHRFGIGTNQSFDAVGSVTISKPQVELGLTPTAYIENTSTSSTKAVDLQVDEPRFDYSKGEPRLMFEAKKQNLIIFSEFIQSVQAYNSSLSFGRLSPQGVLNAYRLTADATSNGHFFTSQVVSGLVSGRSYCASIFVKPIAGNSCTHVRFGLADSTATTNVVYSYFDLTGDGAVGSNDEGSDSGTFEFAGIEKLPSGWFRIHIVGNIAVTSLKTVLFLSTDGSNPVAFQDSTAAVDVYGVSIEQYVAADGTANGTKAVTSYIPTYGVAVTRDFDAPMTQNLPSSNQDKYSFFADVTQGEEAASNKAPRLQHSSGSIPANCGYFASGTGNKSFFFDSNAGSGVNRNMSLTKSTSVDNIKYLFVVDNDNLRTKLYVDGSLFADTNMPSGSDVRAMTSRADFDQVRLTASDNGETDFLKTVMTFPTELSHADGEILTGATSFKLYEDMATANNYTVHV